MPIDLPSMRKNSKDCMSAWENAEAGWSQWRWLSYEETTERSPEL
jgi:hypothetical protein